MSTKNKLLLHLKKERGNWVSGELMSNKLAVSRAAIWKHIRKLREEGYVIESSPRKGYLLSRVSDLLIPDEIQEALDTEVFGKKDIVHFKEISSTNLIAKELAAQGAPEGTLIIAEKQTNGRGRRGRNWFSPSGDGIYVSLILRPAVSPGEAPGITLMSAVAVAEALLSLVDMEVRIKWPNDILVNGRKIAGILTEISTEMDAIDYIVVGLGLNVNMPFESFPEEIREKATSILMVTGKRFSRIRLIQAYLRWYEKYYGMYKSGDFDSIMKRWKEFADIIGRKVMVDVIGNKYIGEITAVDNDGVLILKDDEQRSHRIFSGDLTLL